MPSWTSVSPQKPDRWANRRVLIEGIALGVLYGLFFRVVAHFNWGDPSAVISIAFLFLGPVVMGILTVYRAEAMGHTTVWQWIFAPWLAVFLMMLVMMMLLWEGIICIVMALPLVLIASSIGGIIGGLWSRYGKLSSRTTACLALIPFLLTPVESRLVPPAQTRTVSNEIRIHASPTTAWHNIERVPAIAPTEIRTTWAQRIGFPRPVEATLSFEGIGGVRHASFERGVLFTETVTAWEPERRLAFTIRADNVNIPPTTLDEHVTIGGRYFDVLDGEYQIEPLENGDVLLRLISHQRLSTDFNGYAGLWTDAVMQSLQISILQVIQHRCEHA